MFDFLMIKNCQLTVEAKDTGISFPFHIGILVICGLSVVFFPCEFYHAYLRILAIPGSRFYIFNHNHTKW